MSLIVLISQILLMFSFLRIEKTGKKENLITHTVLAISLLFCYNVLISFCMSYIHLPINIYTYSMINVLLAGLLLLYSKKQGRVQEYYVSKMDILAIIVLLVVGTYTCYKNMQGAFNLGYETTDPAVHFYGSKIFAIGDSIFNNIPVPHYERVAGMPLFYVNCGYMMKAFSSFLSVGYYYKVFQVFDGFLFIYAGLLFYTTTSHLFKKEIYKFIGIIVSIFFFLGYPLNAYQFGFGYLPITVVVINAVIYLLYQAKEFLFEEKNRKIIYMIELFMCFFCIFFGYYLFVPVIYSASFLYLAYILWNQKQLMDKENILFMIIVLILPAVLGFLYFVLPSLVSRGETTVEAIALEGYIYRNLYQNFILLIPCFLYGMHLSLKNKSPYFLITLFSLLFTFAVFVLGINNKASSYYFYKMYYVLWLLGFIGLINIINNFIDNGYRAFVIYSLVSFLGIFSLFWINFDEKVQKKNILFNPSPTLSIYFDVYNMNRIYCRGSYLNENQIDLILKVDEIAEDNNLDQVIMRAETLPRLWALSITDLYVTDDKKSIGSYYEDIISIDEFIDSKFKVYFSFGNLSEENEKNIDLSSCNIIITDAGYILVKK